MRFGSLLLIGALGALAVATPALASTNLLINGDFATGSYAPWTIVGPAPADGQNSVVIAFGAGAGYPTGAFGEGIPADLNTSSAFGAYLVSDVPANGGIKQTFNVTSAGKYAISFDYYIPNNGLANPLDANVTAYANTTALTIPSLDADHLGNNGGVWRTVTDTDVLGLGSNSVSFLLNVPGNYNVDGHQISDTYAADFVIANVSVAAVPEPATWAMMLLGFGAIGWTLRGARRNAVSATA